MAMASRTAVQVNPPSAVCAKCRTLRPASSNFCGECGTRLGAAPSLKPARCTSRRATVLFCDVVGYTAMSERLDPEDVFAIIGRALGVVLDAVHRHGGTVNQFLGDGAMALFEAHEGADDHPERAIAAGLDILRDLAPVAADAHRQHGVNDVIIRAQQMLLEIVQKSQIAANSRERATFELGLARLPGNVGEGGSENSHIMPAMGKRAGDIQRIALGAAPRGVGMLDDQGNLHCGKIKASGREAKVARSG